MYVYLLCCFFCLFVFSVLHIAEFINPEARYVLGFSNLILESWRFDVLKLDKLNMLFLESLNCKYEN